MDEYRKWRFGFDDYYDVYVWDAWPGKPYGMLQRRLEELLARAIRVREVSDLFKPSESILKTIHKNLETGRVHTIKPNEEAESMWDMIQKGSAKVWQVSTASDADEPVEGMSDTYRYSEADALEDAILFPDEATGQLQNNLFKEHASALDTFVSLDA